MTKLILTPLPLLQISRYQIPAHGLLPNTSIQGRPLLVYRSAFPSTSLPAASSASASASASVLPPPPLPPLPSSEGAAASAAVTASAIEGHLRAVGVVVPQWRYSMYPTTHFHSTTHEVLCVSAGRARLLFGGDGNARAVRIEVERGDVILVPAGVAHRLLDDLTDTGGSGFEMVGSYPRGAAQWDMCYGKAGEEDKVATIADLAWFESDPIYGEDGPATAAMAAAAAVE